MSRKWQPPYAGAPGAPQTPRPIDLAQNTVILCPGTAEIGPWILAVHEADGRGYAEAGSRNVLERGTRAWFAKGYSVVMTTYPVTEVIDVARRCRDLTRLIGKGGQ